MHLVRQISVGHLSVRELSVGDVFGRGSVLRECVSSRKSPSGRCVVGKMSVGEEFLKEMSVGDVSNFNK